MCDETKKYYQSPATKEDIEKLDDKLENIESILKIMRLELSNLRSDTSKLTAWTQRAGRMAQTFLENFPHMPHEESK